MDPSVPEPAEPSQTNSDDVDGTVTKFEDLALGGRFMISNYSTESTMSMHHDFEVFEHQRFYDIPNTFYMYRVLGTSVLQPKYYAVSRIQVDIFWIRILLSKKRIRIKTLMRFYTHQVKNQTVIFFSFWIDKIEYLH